MEDLQKCLELNRRIREIDDKIIVISNRIMSPKNQIITDMPRGGGGEEKAIDKYLEKKEELEKQKDLLCNELRLLWYEVAEKMKNNNISIENIMLIQFHFFQGKSWKDSVELMKKLFPNDKWNKNKCFRVYRGVCAKLHK